MISSSTAPVIFLKLSFMSAEDRANLIIFTLALLIVSQGVQCITLTVQCFSLRKKKGPSVFCQQGIKGLA